MSFIQGTNNRYQILVSSDVVDCEKHVVIKQSINGTGYCVVRLVLADGSISNQYVHRLMGQAFIQGYNQGLMIDHINHDKTDNSISNLRVVTSAQNSANRQKQSQAASSIYKGVSYDKGKKKYNARITINGQRQHIGDYQSEEAAAWAWNQVAANALGEYAYLNQFLPF